MSRSMDRLASVTERIGQLRTMSVAEAAPHVADLVDDLQVLVNDERIVDETLINLVTRAHRAIHPRATRQNDPKAALAALRDAIEDGPRPPGRPAVGRAVSVRLPGATLAIIDHLAAGDGCVDAAGEPVRAQMIRLLIDEAIAARQATNTVGTQR